MVDTYFSERERGPLPRTCDEIDDRVWGGLYALITARINDNSFGWRFPEQCDDGYGACGLDLRALKLTAAAEIPDIEWPLSHENAPSSVAIMDLLEYAASCVGHPVQGSWHDYMRHHHLDWDRGAGLTRFVQDVNRLFSRNGVAFELTETGQARRLLPEPLRNTLIGATFHTDDAELDRLLEEARRGILAVDVNQRRGGLEKLWDAFERIKTLEPGTDKRVQADALLDKVAGPNTPRMRAALGEEAFALTKIGNTFGIRHSETNQEIPTSANEIDFLFHRMYAFLRLVLKTTGRGG